MFVMPKSKYSLENVQSGAFTSMTCEQCDEMFQECIAEVDPDNPGGYEVCQILWDHCKSDCTGGARLTRDDTRKAIIKAYSLLDKK
jgi:hypothetical protein